MDFLSRLEDVWADIESELRQSNSSQELTDLVTEGVGVESDQVPGARSEEYQECDWSA